MPVLALISPTRMCRLLSQLEQLPPLASVDLAAVLDTRIVTGIDAIVELQPALFELSLRYGQRGTVDHLEYFLSFEDAAKKTPYLVLIGKGVADAQGSAGVLLGAVLVHEYRALGIGTRIFATDDTSGRRTMVAPPDRRMMFAKAAAEALLLGGARLAVVSFLETSPEKENGEPVRASSHGRPWLMTTRRRLIRSHLPLASSMEATLATLGQHTRRNLRYYRRKAEAELGCVYFKEVVIGRAEFLAFNRECTYAVTDERAAWRFASVAKVPGMRLHGIKDNQGRWLSILCARSYYDVVEIDWQMNRDGMPNFSLSTVLRSYFMEYEIAQGTQKMFMEGGTPHPMRLSFAMHLVRDLAVANNRWAVPAVQRAAPVLWKLLNRYLPKSNFLLQMLTGEPLQWRPWS